MPVASVEINATQETVDQPIIWRLGKLFNVVTNLRRARVSEDYGHVALDIEGSTAEVAHAVDYLRALGLTEGGVEPDAKANLPPLPEASLPQPNTIYVHLSTVNVAQAQAPILYRAGKDFQVVVKIERAALEEEGGSVDVSISGPLNEVQRAIAYLHTTGLNVQPRQRSVTDYSNL